LILLCVITIGAVGIEDNLVNDLVNDMGDKYIYEKRNYTSSHPIPIPYKK
jgi:hypothetical protein